MNIENFKLLREAVASEKLAVFDMVIWCAVVREDVDEDVFHYRIDKDSLERDHICGVARDMPTEATGTTDAFMQRVSQHPCGTAACLGGTADLLSGRIDKDGEEDRRKPNAVRWLGLEEDVAEELFNAQYSNIPLAEITREKALRALDDIIAGKHFSSWEDYV